MDGKRSIQDIIPPARSRSMRPSLTPHQESGDGVPTPPTPPHPIDLNPNRPRGFLAFIFVLGGILLIASIAVGTLSTVFHRAYVSVVPYRFEAPVATTFKAALDGEILSYEKVSTEVSKMKTVAASGQEAAEERATGTIVVYNAYSTKSERLITNTRFETKDGLIFRVHAPVVVPGYTTKAGVKVPGSIEVTVYADAPGEKYNLGLTDLTIPGLKGTEQYTLMYAKSKTPMAGGFVGNRAIVDSAVKAAAVTELKAEVDRELREKMRTSLPPGTVMFDSTVSIAYSEGTDRIEGDSAVITVSGIATVPAFKESGLAQAIAEEAHIQYVGELVIENENALSVVLADPSSVSTGAEISMTVSGNAQLLAVYDGQKLVQDLAGKKETDITSVRANYPAIESLLVRIYPFWRSSIPASADRIEVSVDDAHEGV
mgnify:CR=1 FL=1